MTVLFRWWRKDLKINFGTSKNNKRSQVAEYKNKSQMLSPSDRQHGSKWRRRKLAYAIFDQTIIVVSIPHHQKMWFVLYFCGWTVSTSLKL